MESSFAVFAIFLFYGMSFFATGVAITSRETRSSNLKIAGPLWLLALFAYSHAFHEWFELYRRLMPTGFQPWIEFSRLALVLTSFGFLLIFGLRVMSLVIPNHRHLLRVIPYGLLTLLTFAFILHWDGPSANLFSSIDARIRNLIGLPAAMLAGLGMILYSRTVLDISRKGARNFTGAGWALICYGILTGIIPSGTTLPLLNAPIELFRGLSAFALVHFMMNALTTFDEERAQQIEERLARFAKSEKLSSLGQLAFGIAHEINTPLSNLSINLELLQKDLPNTGVDEALVKRCAAMERNLDRASKIARELLTFSTDREAELMPTELGAVIESTLDLLGARRKAYQIRIDAIPGIEVAGIPWKLEEVFLNLLINAMDATPEGGEILITVSQQDGQTIAEVIDSGSGVPEEHLSRVLDPFFSTKEVGKGTGLGLAICFGIMEMHGGTIELKNHSGGGTTVTLTFP